MKNNSQETSESPKDCRLDEMEAGETPNAGPAPTFQDFTRIPVRKNEESPLYRTPLTDESWREITARIKSRIDSLDRGLTTALAQDIAAGLRWLDPIMTRYCSLTCPLCMDPCCDAGSIFFNQADLIYLAAMGSESPPGQTRTAPASPCRYLARDGCTLPRVQRPYVCVWFLCECQMELLEREQPGFQKRFANVMAGIRTSRVWLESLYEEHRQAP